MTPVMSYLNKIKATIDSTIADLPPDVYDKSLKRENERKEDANF